MALKKCKVCGKVVSEIASFCPDCQSTKFEKMASPNRSRSSDWKLLLALLSALVLLFFTLGRNPPPQITENVPSKEQIAKDLQCRANIQCAGKNYLGTANVYCKEPLEKLSKYDFKWDDMGIFETRFSQFRWGNADRTTITYVGDKAKAQTAMGSFARIIYECDIKIDDKNRPLQDARILRMGTLN